MERKSKLTQIFFCIGLIFLLLALAGSMILILRLSPRQNDTFSIRRQDLAPATPTRVLTLDTTPTTLPLGGASNE